MQIYNISSQEERKTIITFQYLFICIHLVHFAEHTDDEVHDKLENTQKLHIISISIDSAQMCACFYRISFLNILENIFNIFMLMWNHFLFPQYIHESTLSSALRKKKYCEFLCGYLFVNGLTATRFSLHTTHKFIFFRIYFNGHRIDCLIWYVL